MNYTEGSEELKTKRAKKMMLWFGIISLSMSFAGLTSAYVVSKERGDWLESLVLPEAFYISLVVIIMSSLTMHFAKKMIIKEEQRAGMFLLLVTLALGLTFIYLQIRGFSEIYLQSGYAFNENIAFSFIYIIVVVHIAHIIAAIISLFVVIYNHFKQKYKDGKTLGIELATTFWHFVDFLWIYLFLFFYFVR
ncbi:cytochrome c oxidase subunit 3 [Aureisphaera sp. CAU 1614]|uniref:Cytochrome c oxidase subunit 3 n=1 Tax=Halomarinibacterium sedimenti TaxID=2857106 RepID=A0A9X1JXY9_9FLAO|nr:cytochrome c oxidase subunit 3 [Halomarinibacterium sedimenti]MBW2938643.1 cytochrome c oxidase subunit 3 [Halomarinibacterium sedimenti]